MVIADYRLPGLDGLSLLERVKDMHPAAMRILYAGEAVTRTSIGFDIPVLGKACPATDSRQLILQLAWLTETSPRLSF